MNGRVCERCGGGLIDNMTHYCPTGGMMPEVDGGTPYPQTCKHGPEPNMTDERGCIACYIETCEDKIAADAIMIRRQQEDVARKQRQIEWFTNKLVKMLNEPIMELIEEIKRLK